MYCVMRASVPSRYELELALTVMFGKATPPVITVQTV